MTKCREPARPRRRAHRGGRLFFFPPDASTSEPTERQNKLPSGKPDESGAGEEAYSAAPDLKPGGLQVSAETPQNGHPTDGFHSSSEKSTPAGKNSHNPLSHTVSSEGVYSAVDEGEKAGMLQTTP